MKYALTLVLLLSMAIITGYTVSANAQDSGDDKKEPAKVVSEPVKKIDKQTKMQMRATHRYSRILNSLLVKTQSLKLSEEQKTQILDIRKNHLLPMIKEENEFGDQHKALMQMLATPDFKKKDAEELVKKSSVNNEKIAMQFLDGLSALRDTIGKENYGELIESMGKRGRDAVQMRPRQRPESQMPKKSEDSKTKE